MSKVKILCTSTGALAYAPERYKKYDIGTVDVHMTFQGVEYLESEMDADWFYSQLETLEDPKNNLPRTSLPAPHEFKAHFDKAIEDGYDEIIMFTISSGLGGTYNAACLMAREYEGKIKIHVVDTRAAAFCEGMHAVKAAEMLEKGYTTEQILKETAWAIAHQEFLGIDGKLDYLIYNGRLKGAKAFMGKLLSICPVLRFNRDGVLEAVESVRTQKKALARLAKYMQEIIGDRDPKDYILYHIYTGPSLIAPLKEFEKAIGLEMNHEDVVMSPASGCHNGPWLAAYGLYRIRREDEAL